MLCVINAINNVNETIYYVDTFFQYVGLKPKAARRFWYSRPT
jgi:hypothetical protein